MIVHHLHKTKKIRHNIDQIVTIINIINIIHFIVTVKLIHNITANLPIALVREILLFAYIFQQILRFFHVLQDIEDETICKLQSLNLDVV